MTDNVRKNLHGGRTECPCPKVNCERHGKCDECIAWHGRKEKLPRCDR